MHIRTPFAVSVLAWMSVAASIPAQSLSPARPLARLLAPIEESKTVRLVGNVHPLAAATASTSTPVDPGTPMERMVLRLKSSPAQEAQLAQLITQQNDPKSPLFHRYLTPAEFAAQFGVADSDIAKLTAWLKGHGFTLEDVPGGKRSIIFSGTAAQVNSAFKTEIRSFRVSGEKHIGNIDDPQIPAALADVVGGFVQLNDFQAKHSMTRLKPLPQAMPAGAQYDAADGHYLAPADYATIYDLSPLYSSGINGAGQSIAIISRSNIALSDIETFRSTFALPPNDPQVVIVDVDPGYRYDGNSTEATLDTEWAGAIAPNATIKLIAGRCTNTSDGVAAAELYAVANNVAPIISVSYGLCESELSAGGTAFYSALWEQAAAQGQTVIVSSGDTGAAGCNSQSDTTASVTGVNGLCSSPFSTCVGGSQFVEGDNPGQYWQPGNSPAGGSAISYIPETTWNESAANGGGGLIASGGGASIAFSKPSWQTGPGVPNDGKRDVPDVSLSAAQHDGYAMYQAWAGGLFSVAGTSLSAPSFAGLMALVNQKADAQQGLANPVLYALAAKQATGGAAVFHDITTGNNSVPGVTGFSAGPGYDLATGLGSVDAAVLVNHWADAVPQLTLRSSAGVITVNAGQTIQATISVTASAGFNSAVVLSAEGIPANVPVTFSPSVFGAPGSGTSVMQIAPALTANPGYYSLIITATGGGTTTTLSLTLGVKAPSFTLVPTKTNVILNLPSSTAVAVTATAQTGFKAALTLSVTGAPAGVTATLSARSLPSPGSGSVQLNLATAKTTVPGTYPLTISAQGGGQTQTAIVYLVIPTFTVTAPASFYTASAGTTLTFPVTVTPSAGFGSSIQLLPRAGYIPSGVTVSFSSNSVSGSAPSTTTVSMTLAKTLPAGAYPFFIDGTGGNITQGTYEWLLVGISGSCTLAVYDSNWSGNVLSVTAGQSVTGEEICLWPQGSFTGPFAISFSGVPAGVTVQPAGPLMGDQKPVNLTLSTPQTMAAGVYQMFISGSNGGFKASYPFSINVTAKRFVLTPAQNALTVTQGTAATLSVSSAHQGVFNSAVNLAWSGLPSGVTASLSKSSLSAPGDGTAVTTFAAGASAAPGVYTALLTATGGGLTQTASVTLTVAPPSCTLGVSASTLNLSAGQTGTVQISCTAAKGTFPAPLTLSLTGVPANATATLGSSTLTPGATATLQIKTPIDMGAANFNVSVSAAAAGFNAAVPLAVAVAASNFTMTAAQSTLTVTAGTSGQASATLLHHGLFNSALGLAWSGLPTGVTASLNKVTLSAPGDGTVNTTFAVAANTKPGTYSPLLTATGGGVTQTLPLSLTIAPAPSCTLTVSSPSSPLVITAGTSSAVQVSCGAVQGKFSAPLSVVVKGAPAGIAATLSASTMQAGGTVSLQIAAEKTASASTISLQFTASSGTFTQTLPISASLVANSFSFVAAQTGLTVKQGAAGQVSLAATHLGVFNSAVNLSLAGLPAGVTGSLSKTALPAPGDGTTVATFTASATARTGTYNVTLTATGGGQTQTTPITLTIAAK